MGLRSQVDAEVVADRLGLDVCTWPVQVLREMRVDDVIGVARRLDAPRRGRLMAHAIRQSPVHPGNHPWMQDHTLPGHRVQREAGEFAPTGPSTAVHARDGGRAGRRRPGVRPVLVRTGGVRQRRRHFAQGVRQRGGPGERGDVLRRRPVCQRCHRERPRAPGT